MKSSKLVQLQQQFKSIIIRFERGRIHNSFQLKRKDRGEKKMQFNRLSITLHGVQFQSKILQGKIQSQRSFFSTIKKSIFFIKFKRTFFFCELKKIANLY